MVRFIALSSLTRQLHCSRHLATQPRDQGNANVTSWTPDKGVTQRVFSQRTDRVKGIDLHPTEPWLVACLYSGHVYVWNYNDGTVTKSFEVTELPGVRRKQAPAHRKPNRSLLQCVPPNSSYASNGSSPDRMT